ncbi:MAG: biopolymer transporter ExbD [Verrucomicrobiales bacterium]|nr:biopolymer transporter ExbD [Verrucomicrobiales bacterium]
MKLETTLNDRAGMLYTGPLMDVILLLLIFFLFGSNFVLKSGVEVDLPLSNSVLPSAEDAHIITLIPNDSSEFYFNDERVDLEGLESRLDLAILRSKQVILLGDKTINYGTVMEISQAVLRKGFEVSFATQQEGS